MKSAITILLVLFSVIKLEAQSAVTAEYIYPAEVKAGEEFTVQVTIQKGTISGIARIRQEWPVGFYISEQENDGAIFSYSGQLLQFLWINLPSRQTCTIAYKVKANPEYSGSATIPVKFYYLEGQDRKEINLPALKLLVNGSGEKTFTAFVELPGKTEDKSPVANSAIPVKKEEPKTPATPVQPKKETNTGTKKTDQPQPVTPAKPADVSKVVQPAKEAVKPAVAKETPKPQTAIKKEAAQPVKNVPAKKEVVSFRIQIGAFPQQADKAIIAKEFSVPEKDIAEEKHNNLFKYTTGSFPSLQAARKVMTANPAMKGKAFIAGYKDGERIDMEEAIRLTK